MACQEDCDVDDPCLQQANGVQFSALMPHSTRIEGTSGNLINTDRAFTEHKKEAEMEKGVSF